MPGKSKNITNPILLCILDGWGISSGDKNNAIALAKTPNYNQILQNYPHSSLKTSGLDVGLPEGQMGNSEVGHAAIGSGRIIFQDLPRINNSIRDGDFAKKIALQNLIQKCRDGSNACHLLGLFSDGGVHSHLSHIIALAKIIAGHNIEVKIHAFLDGRDVAQKSAMQYFDYFNRETKQYSNIKIVTISGRHYAMDRDNNWSRIELAYRAIVNADGKKSDDVAAAIAESYQESITDEFIIPTIIGDYQGVKDGEGLLFANFRSDRVRQISSALADKKFSAFEVKKINWNFAVAMTEYSQAHNQYLQTLFTPIEVKNSLGEILQSNNLKQLRIAETEKYAHVTFFFSGGQESEFEGENRVMVKSPNVKTYDLMPQMSAIEVTEKLVEAINAEKYDFIVVNYANPDMVGHSGVMESSIKACEVIDAQLKLLQDAILAKNGSMIITADHGNIECMKDDNQNPHTAHTTNPVPFILIGDKLRTAKLSNGNLADIAPSILSLMNIDQPAEMTGKNLINK